MTIKIPPHLGPGWITVQELASKLGLSTMGAYKAMHNDSGLEIVSIGKRYYIKEASIVTMLKARTEKRLAAATSYARA